MSEYIHKSHNVSVLIYHLVCPAKYCRVVFSKEVDKTIKTTCCEISKRYNIRFLEIGTDKDHVHFLIQTVPIYKLSETVKKIKSITAREVFQKHPEVKKKLWGGEFWSDGYFINSVSQKGNESTIMKYIQNQGKDKEYIILHKQSLF